MSVATKKRASALSRGERQLVIGQELTDNGLVWRKLNDGTGSWRYDFTQNGIRRKGTIGLERDGVALGLPKWRLWVMCPRINASFWLAQPFPEAGIADACVTITKSRLFRPRLLHLGLPRGAMLHRHRSNRANTSAAKPPAPIRRLAATHRYPWGEYYAGGYHRSDTALRTRRDQSFLRIPPPDRFQRMRFQRVCRSDHNRWQAKSARPDRQIERASLVRVHARLPIKLSLRPTAPLGHPTTGVASCAHPPRDRARRCRAVAEPAIPSSAIQAASTAPRVATSGAALRQPGSSPILSRP